jgi:hypothetical protein
LIIDKANKKKCPRLIVSTGGGVKEKTDEKEGGNYCPKHTTTIRN